MNTKRIGLLLIVALVLLPGSLAAQKVPPAPPVPGAPKASDVHPLRLAQFLGLSETQVGQVKDLLEAQKTQGQALHEQIAAKQKQLDELLGSSAADPTAVGKLVLEIRALRQQVQALGDSFRNQFLALLTSEQKEKLEKAQEAVKIVPFLGALGALHLIEPPEKTAGAAVPGGMGLMAGTMGRRR